MDHAINIDLGSSNLKMTLFGPGGDIVHVLRCVTPLSRPSDGMVTMHPERLLEAVRGLFAAMVPHCRGEVSAVSVTGMAKSELPLDGRGEPLYPCITWMDDRCRDMEERDYSPIAGALQQYPVIANALPFKLEWMRRHEPEILRKSRVWVNIVDYLHMRLAGGIGPVTDYTEVCRSMVYDSLKESWNEPVAAFFGVDLGLMPEVRPSGTVIGRLHPDFGLGGKTAVVLGGHDHMCAAKAAGMRRKGDRPLLSTGTSEVLAFPFEQEGPFRLPPCNLDHQTDRETLALVGCVARSGDAMRWADGLFGLYGREKNPSLTMRLLADPAGIPLYVPPYRFSDPKRRGGFSSDAGGADKDALCLAVLEGLAHASRALFETMREAAGTAEGINLVGGFSGMPQLLALKAAALGEPITVYPRIDMPSLGGYLLCRQALEPSGDMDAACRDLLARQESFSIDPDPRLQMALESRHSAYRALEHALDAGEDGS
ncbi:MAG: hypothetical protein LIP28_09100 [Deltaproteobacteria bacterium]|nr:hypothetical protein [Deltaproteobacteria bacterium]